MADKTGIEWADATWNPVTGCTKVSPGCDHCYAETLFNRFNGPGAFDTVTLKPERLDIPTRWKKPRRIFVNSMSDLFHDDVPDAFIAHVFAVMALAPRHTFQVLTKRHGRMRSLLQSVDFWRMVSYRCEDAGQEDLAPDPMHPSPNVWLGVSVETQQWADIRIPALLETPAVVRFLSCEPLLGPVDLFANTKIDTGTLVDWVIVGGESGHGARPMSIEWARLLRQECHEHGIPFLFKQWGEHAPVDRREARHGDVWVLGEGHPHPTVPWRSDTEGAEAHIWGPHRDVVMRRVGKKKAGRVLDGRTHDEFPTTEGAQT